MRILRRACLLMGGLACLAVGVYIGAAETPSIETRRETSRKQFNEGNFNDAYKGLRAIALDDKNKAAGGDLTLAIQALTQLGRVDEIDEFREAVVAIHKADWRTLLSAAISYINHEHQGFIVAGNFSRGYRRGAGKYVSAAARDRVRALQLLIQAKPLASIDADRDAVSDYYMTLGNAIRFGGEGRDAWKLQDLTDLSSLPDYEESHRWGRRWGGHFSGDRGAPVDEKGEPIFYAIAKDWDSAKNDGERWRWCLVQAAEYRSSRLNEVDMIWADFCRSQYGVQTMHQAPKPNGKDGTFSLHTLTTNETIARLATGVKRFALPKEHNWFEIWARVIARGKGDELVPRIHIAQEYEDRRQYPKSADAWREVIAKHGKGGNNEYQDRLDQIVGNWGVIEPFQTQQAASKATFDLRFRNATKVTFEAHALKVEKLLTDVRDYLKTNPNNPDWNKTQIGDIGYRIVHQNQKDYVGDKVATWSMDLKPRPNHVDERVTVETPLTNAGAYLVEAKMDGGNASRVILWVADTVILKKMLDGKVMYYVADAITGKPVDKANLEYFGFRHEYVQQPPRGGFTKTVTTSFARNSDADGMVFTDNTDQPSNFNWLTIARKKGDGAGGRDRLAYLGFSGVWFGRSYDPEYHATRVFTMTDRPVYRPENKVQFKAWVRHAKYDQPDNSDFAGQNFLVVVRNPKGEKVFEKGINADEYAGVGGEFTLAKDATLGVYSVQIGDHGHATFRVEEYKKPEFEVKVEAPKEPVKLGDQIEATIQAKYYFGAPVTKGKAKIKVLRTSHTTTWYAAGRWDWFYGAGYWWFAADYRWYPGFMDWGCCRPHPIWMHAFSPEQPEVVMENEVPVGPDGLIKIVIDTTAAKELHGDTDHKYAITAEVVDESRRTIVGTGDVIASRKPFSVFSWVDRGYYRSGDTIKASFQALTPDKKPVKGTGKLALMAISYKDAQPVETEAESWNLDTDEQGRAELQIKAAKSGQYRLVYKLTDAKKNTIEGGYVFVVRGEAFTGTEYRFNDIELTTDKREYSDGDKLKLLINTNQQDGTVLLFARPAGVYQAPKMLRIKGKSTVEELDVSRKDMPNFFVEAVTIHGGRVHTEVREVVVPPEKRVLNVEVVPDSLDYKPGQKAKMKVRLTDFFGKPFVGTTVMSVYDRSVEYISGGSNVPEIKEFFWKWRRSHYPNAEHSLAYHSHHISKPNEKMLGFLGRFGHGVVEEMAEMKKDARVEMQGGGGGRDYRRGVRPTGGPAFGGEGAAMPMAPGMAMAKNAAMADGADAKPGEMAKGESDKANAADPAAPPGQVEPTVRKNFADTAYFNGTLTTDKEGLAEVTFNMPEQTTGWKVRVWGMGHGTKVGQGEAEVTTRKDLLLRMQSPRFFVQKDEVVLSANVHNYLKTEKLATVSLETEGGTLALTGALSQKVKIAPGGEVRVDWRVKVTGEGPTVVRMKATTDEESDAMQMSFNAYVHGMLKMESFSGVVRPDQNSGKIEIMVPKDRRVPQSRLEVRYSPTLAGAMVDALPYLVEYPYGCTEQTLNRFLPSVITQKVLMNMKLDLEDIKKKRVNLNAAEIGDAKDRAKGWKRLDREPVFDKEELQRMVRSGVTALTNMQCSDGGWGWFSGYGERSYPHTTAVVVHGLQIAQENDVALVPGMLDRGIAWLKSYQEEQVRLIQRAPAKVWPYKEKADSLDAFVYMVLMDAKVANPNMRELLYRDRIDLPVYAKALFGLALHKEGGQNDKLAMILKNCEQFVVEDDENQTAYLKLPAGNAWWYWHGNEIEANAWYLKLLSATSPKDKKASGLVKYLLNNRKHATYWNSTRDTALCIEAMAAYMKASGEDKPDLTIEVLVDGKVAKEVKVDAKNLFAFDNTLILEGEAVTDGKHTIEVRKKGTGPVYFNAYLTNFTTEDFITKAGLEVKVNRKYYKLTREDKKVKAPGSRGELTDKRVEKYVRTELKNLDALKSGDLVEVELEIDSKNDYEYLVFEDMKASGFEPMESRSGYNGNDMGAYMELRDERVCFFVRSLPRGKHSVSYRLRAEIPGLFSALPARGSAMYAPELKGNSDEIKLRIED